MSFPTDTCIELKKRIPKKILHFSDGTLEEYSSDDELDSGMEVLPPEPVNAKELSWVPYLTHIATSLGTSALATVDYIGGGLANALGISSPKYFYEIEEYKRMLEEENAQQKESEEAFVGWSSSESNVSIKTSAEKYMFQKEKDVSDYATIDSDIGPQRF